MQVKTVLKCQLIHLRMPIVRKKSGIKKEPLWCVLREEIVRADMKSIAEVLHNLKIKLPDQHRLHFGVYGNQHEGQYCSFQHYS